MFWKSVFIIAGLLSFCLYAHHEQRGSREEVLRQQTQNLQQQIVDLNRKCNDWSVAYGQLQATTRPASQAVASK